MSNKATLLSAGCAFVSAVSALVAYQSASGVGMPDVPMRPANALPIISVSSGDATPENTNSTLTIPGAQLSDAVVWNHVGDLVMSPSDMAVPPYEEVNKRFDVLAGYFSRERMGAGTVILPNTNCTASTTCAAGVYGIRISNLPVTHPQFKNVDITAFLPTGGDILNQIMAAVVTWASLQHTAGQPLNVLTGSESTFTALYNIMADLGK